MGSEVDFFLVVQSNDGQWSGLISSDAEQWWAMKWTSCWWCRAWMGSEVDLFLVVQCSDGQWSGLVPDGAVQWWAVKWACSWWCRAVMCSEVDLSLVVLSSDLISWLFAQWGLSRTSLFPLTLPVTSHGRFLCPTWQTQRSYTVHRIIN